MQEYGVSRNVFMGAFDQLLAEAYLVSFKGKGTFVSKDINLNLLHRKPVEVPPPRMPHSSETCLFDFSIGNPDLTRVPLNEWGSCIRRAVKELKPSELGYKDSYGTKRFQEALKQHLLVTRGMQFEKEQVFITSGSFQALLLTVLTATSVTDSKKVIIENPSFSNLSDSMVHLGASLCPVETDHHGLIPEKIPADQDIGLVCTTPSHLFPDSSVFPIHRRLKLCQMADNRDFYILENDFEGDIRLTGTPIPSMQSLNRDRIFYTGTFSQILYPAVRVGYLIAPAPLVNAVQVHFKQQGYGVPLSIQNGLALLIEEGILLKHYRKMKRLYQIKQEFLVNALQKSFGDHLILKGLDTGSYLTASFKGVLFSERIVRELEKAGIRADYEFRHYWPSGSREQAPGILLGFGNLDKEQIEQGILKLKETLEKLY